MMELLLKKISKIIITIAPLFFTSPAVAQVGCPESVEQLTENLLQDLPSYANRVIQQSKLSSRSQGDSTYVILAGKPEFNPLTENQTENYLPSFPNSENPTVPQVFFTTLERHYTQKTVHSVENYHWLFLTETEQGWRIVFLYSRFGLPDKNHPPTPPQETTNGIIGTAIQLWLRDCRFQNFKVQK